MLPRNAILCLALTGAAPVMGDVVRLESDAELTGTVVKQNEHSLWIDLGHQIIEVPNAQIVDVVIEGTPEEVHSTRDTLFHTAENPPELSIRQQAARVKPSVVLVRTPSGLGSGVFINDEGHAITNAHVIQGEQDLQLVTWIPQEDGTLKRTTLKDVEIVAVNDHLDLALLKATHPAGGRFSWSPLERFETIEVGQPVFAIGNPLGLEQTTSQGVISTTQRNMEGLSYVQTDAAINPGNSGGPLFNTRGEVVGITNMGILGGEALGFAIPTRYVKDFIRNREAFVYDPSNPNSGHIYNEPPRRKRSGSPPLLADDQD
ncbi:MAG: trypsin-like peptidase domain-containing protein [Phycisphaerales bacterium]|nr:trypsin-like peptidase domain-containing protein [Phycisphaerales bacterium]